MRTCTICSSEKRSEIELSVTNGTSLRDVAVRHGVSHMAIQRHMAGGHIKQAAKALQARREETQALDVIEEMQKLYHRMSAHLDRIEQTNVDDWQAIRAFHAEVRRDLELLGKFSGALDERPQVTILLSAEWQATRSAILTALAPFPDARLSVVASLSELEQRNRARLN